MVNIDELLEQPQLFRNKSALLAGFRPDKLTDIKHREIEITQYATHMRDIMRNVVPGNMLLTGPVGTGKTLVAQTVLSEIVNRATAKGVLTKTIYIYCDKIKSSTKILRTVYESLEKETGHYRKNKTNDTGDIFEWYCTQTNMYDGIIVIILDEIDKIKDHDLVGSMSRTKECNLSRSNVSIIGITNDTEFLKSLDTRTASVIAAEEIIFNKYDAVQLTDILTDRANLAYLPGTISSNEIQLCAALAAKDHGDARKAIQLLRVAGEIAEYNAGSYVTEADIWEAKEKLETDTSAAIARGLPLHSKLILISCIKMTLDDPTNTITSGSLFTHYSKVCKGLETEPLTERRIADIINELDMMGLIQSSITAKHRRGRTRIITCNSPMTLQKVLVKEEILLDGLKIKIN